MFINLRWRCCGAMILSLILALSVAGCASTAAQTVQQADATASATPDMPQGAPPDSSGEAPAPPEGDPGMPPDGKGGPGTGNPGVPPDGGEQNGAAAVTLNQDTEETGVTYTSEAADENALRVEGGAQVALTNATITKTAGDTSNTDSSNFYGMNAGALVRDKATLILSGGSVTTAVSGGNGVFAYGSGTTLDISNVVIRTQKDHSGGIEAAGGSTVEAVELDVETQGASAAAIRSDRGGGTMHVSGGTFITNGTGSPAVYSTADITVQDAVLTANSSEAVVVEGKNSVSLLNCTVTGNMTGTYRGDSSENIHNVMLYQSMSGDADVGCSNFAMTGGTLTGKRGDLFYVTNTTCNILLENVQITASTGNLLTVSGNDSTRNWGKAGANGGNCTFSAKDQILAGTITCDKISTLDLKFSDGASFTGAINPDGAAGTVTLSLDGASTITLTADSYVTTFTGDASAIQTNGHSLYVNGVKLA